MGFLCIRLKLSGFFSSDLALKRVFLAKKKQVTMAEKLPIETKKINNAVLVGSTTIMRTCSTVWYRIVYCKVQATQK